MLHLVHPIMMRLMLPELRNAGARELVIPVRATFVHDGKLNVVGTGRVSTTAGHDGAKDRKSLLL